MYPQSLLRGNAVENNSGENLGVAIHLASLDRSQVPWFYSNS